MMRSRVVVQEEEVRTHTTSKHIHLRQENLSTIADTNEWNWLGDVEVLMVTKQDSAQTGTPVSPKRPFSIILEGWLRVPCSLQMGICPQSLARINRFSSVNNTRSHSCYVPFLCFWHHRNWCLRWAGVNGTYPTGRRVYRPPFFNLYATIKWDIRHQVVCYMCLVISPAVFRLLLFDCKTI